MVFYATPRMVELMATATTRQSIVNNSCVHMYEGCFKRRCCGEHVAMEGELTEWPHWGTAAMIGDTRVYVCMTCVDRKAREERTAKFRTAVEAAG